MTDYPRVHADIDLNAMLHNMDEMHRLIHSDTKIMAVIKTDGYGHGATMIAKELEAVPYVYGYAVAAEEEGLALRATGIKKPILILGYTFEEQYEALLQAKITPAIFSLESAQRLSEVAQRLDITTPVHIKLDTGMGRVGFLVSEESADLIAHISKLPNIMIEGLFTHFARADETDKTSALEQLKCFMDMVQMLEKRNVHIPLKHCSNSAGILDLPQANLDIVRAGITLYGMCPSDEVHVERMEMQPVLSLKSRVVHVKTLPKGYGISYGATYVTDDERRIATIPVGYGDGYARSLSNCGEVLIHGKRAPILGRVCMDQFMVDVTDIPDVKVSDTVTLIGTDGAECITLEELGEKSGRFNYEFACDIGKRIPRVFYKDGKKVAYWTQFEGFVE
ncbi:MAG: alanine racemase [Eubacterium sp.]|nr:alanine racemase [Eubacterium sp.]